MKVGSRRQVWNGTAERTGYGAKGLTKGGLVMKNGRITSIRASKSAKKNKNLGKYIDIARKSKGKKFSAMRKNMTRKNSAKGTKKKRKSKKGRKCRNTRGRYNKC